MLYLLLKTCKIKFQKNLLNYKKKQLRLPGLLFLLIILALPIFYLAMKQLKISGIFLLTFLKNIINILKVFFSIRPFWSGLVQPFITFTTQTNEHIFQICLQNLLCLLCLGYEGSADNSCQVSEPSSTVQKTSLLLQALRSTG